MSSLLYMCNGDIKFRPVPLDYVGRNDQDKRGRLIFIHVCE